MIVLDVHIYFKFICTYNEPIKSAVQKASGKKGWATYKLI